MSGLRMRWQAFPEVGGCLALQVVAFECKGSVSCFGATKAYMAGNPIEGDFAATCSQSLGQKKSGVAQLPFSACGVRCVNAPPPNLWRRVSRCCACVRDGRCNCSTFTLSPRSGASWAARTEPLLGETASQERASASGASSKLRPCAAEVGEEAASLVTAEVAVVWEKARIPTQKKSRCVEGSSGLYASWQNLDRSKKRSAEVDVANRRSFSLALMTLFDIGHADAFDLITVDEDRQFSRWASAARMDPVASCKESTNPLGPQRAKGFWSAAC
ncbi:hypothetical protein GWK47_044752 [Chionoecetes opilio]|uniref:Uncharacterized protein n=1 Tax=Chionoecetes opilio TaxID=41210 RepID=A0A8J4YFJ3_CHIOP|nr:hypothetical protein GWK47_044752 [Chionoecetes opilio]